MDRELAIIEGILFASGEPVKVSDIAAAMGLAGRKKAMECFTAEQMISRVMEVLRERC